MTRRDMFATSAAAVLIAALGGTRAWAGGRPAAMDAWAREVVHIKDDLQAERIDVREWQRRIEAANRSVPVDDLVRTLDIDAITRKFAYPSLLADVADPVLPPDLLGPAGMRGWFVRVFGMRRGGAIIPHVHNGMVSAHLVISGSFHARTHDRIKDLADAVVLHPTRDGELKRGEIISMSDQKDNQHWLIAREDRSLTFDVGVVGTKASWPYGLQANANNMIFVDPTHPPERDGTVVAPVLTFEQAVARFAA
jgi:hypothetical protein